MKYTFVVLLGLMPDQFIDQGECFNVNNLTHNIKADLHYTQLLAKTVTWNSAYNLSCIV